MEIEASSGGEWQFLTICSSLLHSKNCSEGRKADYKRLLCTGRAQKVYCKFYNNAVSNIDEASQCLLFRFGVIATQNADTFARFPGPYTACTRAAAAEKLSGSEPSKGTGATKCSRSDTFPQDSILHLRQLLPKSGTDLRPSCYRSVI